MNIVKNNSNYKMKMLDDRPYWKQEIDSEYAPNHNL